MNEINIRKAETKDSEESIKLIDYVWRIAYRNIFPETVFSERERRQKVRIESFSEDLNNNDVLTYVAEYDGKIVAVMSGRKLSRYEYFAKQNLPDLEILYILPEYQGKGISSKLKNIFQDWLKENHFSKYVIGVLKENEKARKVYEKWGGKLEKYTNPFKVGENAAEEVFYTYNVK